MSIERHHSGSRMSQIVIHNGVVYLAGQVGDGDGLEAQVRSALAKVDALLAEAGSDKSRMLQATIWLADMSDFAAMNTIWDAWIDPPNPPARACGEAKLARPDLLFEVMVIAAQ